MTVQAARPLNEYEKAVLIAHITYPMSPATDKDIDGAMLAIYPVAWLEEFPPLDACLHLLYLHGLIDVDTQGRTRLTMMGYEQIATLLETALKEKR